jgi:hypothetical protein
MTATTQIGIGLLGEADQIQGLVEQLAPVTGIVSLAEKHAAMFAGPAIGLLTSAVFAQHQAMLYPITKSFRVHDDTVGQMLGGLSSEALGIGFTSVVDGISKSFYGDLFKNSGVGLTQNYFKDLSLGLADSYFKTAGIGFTQDSFKHLPIGLPEGLFADSALGVAQGLFRAEATRLLEPITSSIASVVTTGLADWLPEVRSALWLGLEVQQDASAADRSVDAWLYQRRKDLRQKHEGMWDAFMNSCDPVLHAATSAVELLLRLFRSSAVSEHDVQVWAMGTSHEAVAIDNRQGQARVTWTGRALLAAHLAGYDEAGQALIVSLA